MENCRDVIIPNHLPRRKIITALLLGDGGFGISNRKTKPLASMIYTCCSEKYKDYYEWKKQVFIEAVGREGKEYIVNNKKSSRIYCYQYFDSKMIKPYANFLLKDYKKYLPKFLLRMDHPLCLAIWFMDDGNCQSYISKHKDGIRYLVNPVFRLATNQFDYSQLEQAVKWFKTKWDLHPTIVKQTERRWKKEPYVQYTLRFPSKESEKIWSIIRPYVSQIPSMMWKFRFAVHFFDYRGLNKDLELSTVPRVYKEQCGATYKIG